MAKANLTEAANRILEAQGKKARQSLQRKPSGQIYRVPVARMINVLQKIFTDMPDAVAADIINKYVASVKKNLEAPFLLKLSKKDPLFYETMIRRRNDQRAKSSGMKVFAVPSFRFIVDPTSGPWQGKKKEYKKIINESSYIGATEDQLQSVAGRDNKAGSQIGHAEGSGSEQVGLASSTVGVARAKSIVDEIAAKQVEGIDRIQTAISNYEKKMSLTIDHTQIISADGTFNKNYIPILTDQASTDNQDERINEAAAVAAFNSEIKDIVLDETSTAVPDAIAQISMYNIAQGKNVKSTGVKKRQIREKSSAKAEKITKAKDEYEVATDGGPDVSEYIKRTKRTGRRQKDRYSIAALIGIINEKLPQTVRKNMGAPRLESQTGRFAQSVKMMDASRTSQGYVSLGYTYAKNPYQVFETGTGKAPWATPERDPRRLIDQSIREVAAGLALGRFYTRRL